MRHAIGDIHGHKDELLSLLNEIGATEDGDFNPKHTTYFVGDFVDRGPDSAGVLETVMDMVDKKVGHAVRGNQHHKLRRFMKNILRGTEQTIKPSLQLAATVKSVFDRGDVFANRVYNFLDNLPYYLHVDSHKIVHAYYPGERTKKKDLTICMYGPTDKENVSEEGHPLRIKWWETYDGRHGKVIFGHYHAGDIVEYGHCVCIDTGVHESGKLLAYKF